MHDPKTYHNEDVPRFEKEVQQKMEELSFTPSDAVWANVAQGIASGKRRRRVPIFWLFFLPALLLVGAAGIYFISGHSARTGTTISGNNPQPNSQEARNDRQPEEPRSNTPQPNSRQSNNHQPDNHQPVPGQSTTISQAAKIASSAIDQPAAIRPGSFHHATGIPENNGSDRSSIPFADRSITGNENLSGKPTAGKRNATIPGKPAAGKRTATVPDEPAAETGEETSMGKVARINLNPVSGRNAPKITAAPLATKSLAITKTRLRPKRPWEAGFAGGIGVSSLNQALLKRSAIASYDNRNSTAAITGQPQTYISKIQPDIAFWVGILMQKPISNNLSISTGLNLRYYSTRIHTGDKIDLTGALSNPAGPSNNNSLALSAITYAAAAPTSYPYYNAGDKHVFINRYYFLEIPASIQWQITHNRQMPVFWEGGFSLSYLMSSNALYYNDKAGVYYKDGDVTNKIQFNLSTALMVGIPFQGVNLQVGPQVQYGLTSLLNTQNSGQHLFYGGLKMVVIPGKSHKAGRRLFKEE